MRSWVLLDDTGAVVAQVFDDETPERDLQPGWTAHEARHGDLACERFDGAAWVPAPELLDASLLSQVDAEAGAFRSRFITVSPGKELTYMRKELDARDCLAGGAGPWPMLAQEAEVRRVTVPELAATIVAKSDTWQVIGGAIEAATVCAKAAVLAAATADEKRAAAAVDWEALATLVAASDNA